MWDLKLRRPTWDIRAQTGPICSLLAVPVQSNAAYGCERGEGGTEINDTGDPYVQDSLLTSPPSLMKFEVSPGDEIIVTLSAATSSPILHSFSLIKMFDAFLSSRPSMVL